MQSLLPLLRVFFVVLVVGAFVSTNVTFTGSILGSPWGLCIDMNTDEDFQRLSITKRHDTANYFAVCNKNGNNWNPSSDHKNLKVTCPNSYQSDTKSAKSTVQIKMCVDSENGTIDDVGYYDFYATDQYGRKENVFSKYFFLKPIEFPQLKSDRCMDLKNRELVVEMDYIELNEKFNVSVFFGTYPICKKLCDPAESMDKCSRILKCSVPIRNLRKIAEKYKGQSNGVTINYTSKNLERSFSAKGNLSIEVSCRDNKPSKPGEPGESKSWIFLVVIAPIVVVAACCAFCIYYICFRRSASEHGEIETGNENLYNPIDQDASDGLSSSQSSSEVDHIHDNASNNSSVSAFDNDISMVDPKKPIDDNDNAEDDSDDKKAADNMFDLRKHDTEDFGSTGDGGDDEHSSLNQGQEQHLEVNLQQNCSRISTLDRKAGIEDRNQHSVFEMKVLNPTNTASSVGEQDPLLVSSPGYTFQNVIFYD